MRLTTRWIAYALACALPLAALPAAGQESCTERLRAAEAQYQEGRFDAVLESLEPCLGRKTERQVRIEAQALLGKTYLAEDRLDDARRAVRTLLALQPAFEPSAVDPPRFAALVTEARRATGVVVSSVSKTNESLLEAPATVAVVTAEEIRERGYQDLEQVVHDLPGFDVTLSNGITYSNIYQRGYRSDETNRTLFLVDGVEENDLWSGTAYLSRQFPLSNVKRVEVVYGPASTIYGANAYTGVVNVITREPEDYLKDGKRFAVDAILGGGSFGTGYVDTTVAGRTAGGALSFTLTSRVFRSDEPNLSKYGDWNYDPADFAASSLRPLYVNNLSISDDPGLVQELLREHPEIGTSGDFLVSPGSITVTPQGIEHAIALDQRAYDQLLRGHRPAFSDSTDTWLVHGKLNVGRLALGFQTWRDQEGSTPSSTDFLWPGADNGSLWTPEHTWFYARYSQNLPHNLTFTLFSRYKEHTLDGTDSVATSLQSYLLGGRGIADLAAGVEASWQPTYYYVFSTQLRNELRLLYHPSPKLDVVAGLELRNGSIQGGYVVSSQPNPSETGTPIQAVPGTNDRQTRDIGLFAQGSYRVRPDLKLVAGGRVDNDRVQETGGYGTVFDPRLAIVYSPGDTVFKAIYSQAFHDVSNREKSSSNDLSLPPERVKNVELSAGWQVNDRLSAEVAAFDARYSDVVRYVAGQFRAIGALHIRGIQAQASGNWPRMSAYANYTYTDPFNSDQEVTVADVAHHKLNVGFTASLGKRLLFHLRGNYVGAKKTGEGTDVPSNPLRQIDSYAIASTALTYRNVLPGWSLELTVENLFDASYRDPGVRDEGGLASPSSIPQPGRAIYLRLLTAAR